MKYNFSLIIPHKNIPDLLQKALDSVPKRDDIQIIIVDDNSDAQKVDFERFPGLGNPNTEVYFTKEGKGAGYARNVGLDHAKGKWLFFMDADDVLTDNMDGILDECINDEVSDLVYFDHNVSCKSAIKSSVRLFNIKANDITEAKYSSLVPWGKLVRKQIVDLHKIRFEEIVCSNDTMFSLKVSTYSKRFRVIDKVGYIYVQRPGSLWNSWPKESIMCRLACTERCYNWSKKHRLAYSLKYMRDTYLSFLMKLKGVDTPKYYSLLIQKGIQLGFLPTVIKNYLKSQHN